eukprot:sb/3475442/
MMCHSSFYLHHCIFCEKFSCTNAADKTPLPLDVESYFCNTLISFVKTVAVLEIRVLVSRYLLLLLVQQTHHLSFDLICVFPSLYSPHCISQSSLCRLSLIEFHHFHICGTACEVGNLSHSLRSCDK